MDSKGLSSFFSSFLCSAPHSPFLTIAFPSLPISRRNEPGITATVSSVHPQALKTLAPRFSACHLSLSLTLRRHSDILSLNVANEGTKGSFSFSFLTANARERLSHCLERVVNADLVAECRGFGRDPVRHGFFLPSTPFSSSLTFVFLSLSSVFHIKRPFYGPTSSLSARTHHGDDPSHHYERSLSDKLALNLGAKVFARSIKKRGSLSRRLGLQFPLPFINNYDSSVLWQQDKEPISERFPG
jgi:hypothetical protein